MTVFLTGGTGFLGGALARQLVASGHRVRAIVRAQTGAVALASMGVELYTGDVTDKASLRQPMTGVDAVFHVAGWYKVGLRRPREAYAVNVGGTQNVLELMQELAIPRGVYTSTLAVNSDTHGRTVDESYRFQGHHLSLYDQTKADAHQVAEGFIARGLPLTIVQPGAIYGPGDTSFVRTTLIQFLDRKLPAIPTRSAYAWAHVNDVADGHVLALERGQAGRAYFLAGPIHSLVDALQIASEITHVPPPRFHLSPGILRTAAWVVRPVDAWLPPAFTAEGLRVLAGVTYLGSNGRAKRELGWRPRPLRDGFAETLRHEMTLLGMTPAF